MALAAAGCGSTGCSEPPGFVDHGSLRAGYGVVSDLRVFDGRLVAAVNADPLVSGGAAVVATSDGRAFELLLDQEDSEGILRLRTDGDRLVVPDADPPGQEQGRVWVIDGAGAVETLVLPEVAHSYDALPLDDGWLVSGGAVDYRGALHRGELDAAGAWLRVAAVPALRMQYLAPFAGRVFASKAISQQREDYYRWAPGGEPEAVDAFPGEAQTWNWFVSPERGRLYWSSWTRSRGSRVRVTEDGERWEEVPALEGRIVWDFAELGGVLYALAEDGLWGAADGLRFEPLLVDTSLPFFAPVPARNNPRGINVEAQASLVAWKGALWAGSLRDAKLYRAVLP